MLPGRLAGYEPAWLDDQCLAGHVAWARLRPRNGRADGRELKATPVRTTPITLLPRRHASLWAALSPPPDAIAASPRAAAVIDPIRAQGASFFDELLDAPPLLRPQLQEPPPQP